MLSLLKGASEFSELYPDHITLLTSVKHLQTVRADNSVVTVIERIHNLLSSTNTRLQGLQLLEIALHQNSDIYVKGRWTIALCDIIREPVSCILKEHACKILCLLIPYIAKDVIANVEEAKNFTGVLFPFLLVQVENKVEWIESAAMCLSSCLKYFPQLFVSQKDRLLRVILKEISYSVSSRTFEVFAECFCFIPSCLALIEQQVYKRDWKTHYEKTLNSMYSTLCTMLEHLPIGVPHDPSHNLSKEDGFSFDNEDDDEDDNAKIFPRYLKVARRFINLSKCLAKMLSTKPKFDVEIPIRQTLICLIYVFPSEISKASAPNLQAQITLSTYSQMQIACFAVLESLISNFSLVSHSALISNMLSLALQGSKIPSISNESISPLRQALWKFLHVWIGKHGAKISSCIVSQQLEIIEELLKDINIENPSQTNAVTTSAKSKKNMSMNTGRKSVINKGHQTVCKEALKVLEDVLYSGSSFISKKLLQDIFTKVVEIAYAITPQENYPFPYDDDMCRKLLYSVLLAVTIITKADQREPLQCATGIFKTALQDHSSKVVRQCYKAMAMCRLCVHPKKPIPVFKESDDKQRRAPSTVDKYSEWASDDYVHNLPPIEMVSNVSENLTPRIAQTFHNPNEGEMSNDEYMHIDSHYSEQAAESQCNGEELLELQNSSHGHEDVDSEDEDEEEDDEHSYGDEEMNQEVEMQTEHMYIPSTSKMQVLNPVHITPETEQNVGEPEYEEWRSCEKSDDSNKNMHLNGVHSSIVPEEGVPSASTQNVTSENGIIYPLEDEDIEEEEGEEDEEEENAVYPAEKRVPEYFETPAKKQKVDNEVKEEPQDEKEEGTVSPTLMQMKDDFVCNDTQDVKS